MWHEGVGESGHIAPCIFNLGTPRWPSLGGYCVGMDTLEEKTVEHLYIFVSIVSCQNALKVVGVSVVLKDPWYSFKYFLNIV